MSRVRFRRQPPELSAGIAHMVLAHTNGHGTMGPEVHRFERDLEAYYGGGHVVAVSSGTEALALPLQVLTEHMGVVPRVALPDITWSATLNAVESYCHLTPVLCDVDTDGILAASGVPNDVEIILPVALYGNSPSAQMGRLRNNTVHRDTPMVVDACQAFEEAGNLAQEPNVRAVAVSFHALKSLPLGTGGAVVTRYPDVALGIKELRYQGVVDGKRIRPGRKATMTAPAAAMGSALLPYVEGWLMRRREMALEYEDQLSGVVDMPRRTLRDCAHAMPVLLPKGVDIEEACQHMDGWCDVSRYYPALSSMPCRPRDFYQFNSSTRSADWGPRLMALPLDSEIRHREVGVVVEGLKRVLASLEASA